jgi:hypothetical protein
MSFTCLLHITLDESQPYLLYNQDEAIPADLCEPLANVQRTRVGQLFCDRPSINTRGPCKTTQKHCFVLTSLVQQHAPTVLVCRANLATHTFLMLEELQWDHSSCRRHIQRVASAPTSAACNLTSAYPSSTRRLQCHIGSGSVLPLTGPPVASCLVPAVKVLACSLIHDSEFQS